MRSRVNPIPLFACLVLLAAGTALAQNGQGGDSSSNGGQSGQPAFMSMSVGGSGTSISGSEFKQELTKLEGQISQYPNAGPIYKQQLEDLKVNYEGQNAQFKAMAAGNGGESQADLRVNAEQWNNFADIVKHGAPITEIQQKYGVQSPEQLQNIPKDQRDSFWNAERDFKTMLQTHGIVPDPKDGGVTGGGVVGDLVKQTGALTSAANLLPSHGGGPIVPVVPGGGGQSPSANPPSIVVQQGYQSLQKQDYDAALQAAQNELSQNPNDAAALRLAAQASANMGDNAAANQYANSYLQKNPGDKDMATLAAITADKGAITGASEAAGQAAGLNPGGADGALAAGGGLLNPGETGRTLTPDQAAADSLARDAKMQAAIDPDSAIGLATKAIGLDSHNPDAYFARGTAYGIKGDYDDGLKDAVTGLANDPKHGGLLALRAQILARQGRWADAQGAAEAALQVNPRNAAAWFAEANALAGEGQRDRALEALRNAAELNPAYAAAYDTAMNAPKDSDLLFLFANPNPNANAVAMSAHKKWRFGAIAGAAGIGGGLLALGLLPFLMPPIKSAFTKLTRRASSVHAAPLEADALADGEAAGGEGLLRGQYRTIRQIGAGGMGMVYEGEDVSLGRKVAIKRMRDEIRSDPRERARFVSEAKVVAALHHPNIVDIYSIVDDGDDAFLVFEYIQGKTLHELVQSKGRLTLDETLPILRGVVDGLEYAHERGVIHRDLKPSNIMLDETGRPRVMDFGIARMAQEALTRAAVTNTIVGTPPYMAPEQEQGLVRKESDVYALSVCLYEMLTGRMAFAGTGAGMLMNKINKSFAPVTTLAPELPPEMDAVFAQALDPDPAKRISSPRELLARIEAVAASRKA